MILKTQTILKYTMGDTESLHLIPAGSDITQLDWDRLSMNGEVIQSPAVQHLFNQQSAFTEGPIMPSNYTLTTHTCKMCHAVQVYAGRIYCASCSRKLKPTGVTQEVAKPAPAPKVAEITPEPPEAILAPGIPIVAKPEQSPAKPTVEGLMPGDDKLILLLGAEKYATYAKTRILADLLRELAQ